MEPDTNSAITPLVRQLVDDKLTHGFVVMFGGNPLPHIPKFDRPSRNQARPVESAKAQVRSLLLNQAAVLLAMSTDQDRSLFIDALLKECFRDVLLRAKTGDKWAAELLVELTTDAATELQAAQGKFKSAIQECASSMVRFPALLGTSVESQSSANGFLTELKLGTESAVQIQPSSNSQSPNIASVFTPAGFVYSIIEYFNDLKDMKIIAGRVMLDEELRKAHITPSLYAAIMKLERIGSENWEPWRAVAVRFLKARYGTLEDACGGSNPSSQLRSAFKAIAHRVNK